MKRTIFKQLLSFVLAIVLVAGYSHSVSAATFADVPAWALPFVTQVTDWGIMSADSAGYFRCDDYIDKFDTSRILARMAGYKTDAATSQGTAVIEAAYSKWKSFINIYVAKFSKWNSSADKEIAYLLEKGIYVTTDLDQFVIISDGVEKLRALTREEIAVFIVRLLGKVSEASALTPSGLFNDDSTISAAARPYVYYLKNLGILSGSDNLYNPKGAVTRAAMAKIITLSYPIINPAVVTTGSNTGTTASSYETISGTIAKLYPGLKAIQISSTNVNYNNKIILTSSNCSIKINNYVMTFNDLTEGSSFSGVITNNELISVSVNSTTVETPSTGGTTSVPTEFFTLEGTVKSVSTVSLVSTIGIEIRMLNPRGEIITEQRTFTLASNCEIKRGNAAITFNSIVANDIVKIKYNGTTAYGITLEEKDRRIIGTLKEKKVSETTNRPSLTILDSDGNTVTLTVNESTYITRKGMGEISWNELRTGDSVDITAVYNTISTMYASGTKTSKDLTIESLYVSKNENYILASTTTGLTEKYPIITAAVDPYTLKVGSKIRAWLDSSEIESVSVLQSATIDYSLGIVTSISSTVITVKDSTSSYYSSREYTYDANTIVIDSSTGNKVSLSRLTNGVKVYVVTSTTNSKYATVITILNN